MAFTSSELRKLDLMPNTGVSSYQSRAQSVAAMKARQAAKIREIADALKLAGFLTVEAQANALKLGRSTAWTILKAHHKASGLSAKIINRILEVRGLPPPVRAKILEYVEEKAAGRYGHSEKLRQKFMTALSAKQVGRNGYSWIKTASPADPPDVASVKSYPRQNLITGKVKAVNARRNRKVT